MALTVENAEASWESLGKIFEARLKEAGMEITNTRFCRALSDCTPPIRFVLVRNPEERFLGNIVDSLFHAWDFVGEVSGKKLPALNLFSGRDLMLPELLMYGVDYIFMPKGQEFTAGKELERQVKGQTKPGQVMLNIGFLGC